jgi:hypothetical protein
VDSSSSSSSSRNSSDAGSAVVFSCWEVPQHLQARHWTAVLAQEVAQLSERQLVLPDGKSSQVLRVLQKFEAADFIHCFMRGACPPPQAAGQSSEHSTPGVLPAAGKAAAGMVWHLPRCSLHFELSASGRVVSSDHRGYALSTQQLLVSQSGKGMSYTLPDFQQYLVLDAQHGSGSGTLSTDLSTRVVLMPSGRVTVERPAPGSSQLGPSVKLELSDDCCETVKVRARLSWAVVSYRHPCRTVQKSLGIESASPH